MLVRRRLMTYRLVTFVCVLYIDVAPRALSPSIMLALTVSDVFMAFHCEATVHTEIHLCMYVCCDAARSSKCLIAIQLLWLQSDWLILPLPSIPSPRYAFD